MKGVINFAGMILLLVSFNLNAQDFPFHYFIHSVPVIENPSLAAADGGINVSFGAYNLWSGGFRPVNDYLVSLSLSPATRKRRSYSRNFPWVGLGVNVLREQIGPFNQYLLQLVYAYHIPLSRNTRLSLGVAGIIENLFIDVTSLSPDSPDDPRLLSGNNQSFLFDGGFGATLASESFALALSVLNLAPGSFRFSDQPAEAIPACRKFFLTTGYSFNPQQSFSFHPQVTLRNSWLTWLNYDASLDVGLRYFQVGAGYRSENSLFAFIRVPVAGFVFSWTSENPLQTNPLRGKGHTFTIGWRPDSGIK